MDIKTLEIILLNKGNEMDELEEVLNNVKKKLEKSTKVLEEIQSEASEIDEPMLNSMAVEQLIKFHDQRIEKEKEKETEIRMCKGFIRVIERAITNKG